MIGTTVFFVYVIFSTKSRHTLLAGFDKAKYQLNKYNVERLWAITVAGLLIYMWVLGFPWMPPVAFQQAIDNPAEVKTIKVWAEQWCWGLHQVVKADTEKINSEVCGSNTQIKAGDTVKFIARSDDVNHAFAILSSDKRMDSPLVQMQVVPNKDNVFYYTFKNQGSYIVRCFEYCGWQHPYMTQQITIQAI